MTAFRPADGAGQPGPADPADVPLATLAARLAAEMEALADLAAQMAPPAGLLCDPRDDDLERLRRWAADLATVQRRLAADLPPGLPQSAGPLVAELPEPLAHRLRHGDDPG